MWIIWCDIYIFGQLTIHMTILLMDMMASCRLDSCFARRDNFDHMFSHASCSTLNWRISWHRSSRVPGQSEQGDILSKKGNFLIIRHCLNWSKISLNTDTKNQSCSAPWSIHQSPLYNVFWRRLRCECRALVVSSVNSDLGLQPSIVPTQII